MTDAHAYIRVSSKSQDHAMQRHAIEVAAAGRGDAIPAGHWFAEKRRAKTMDRPELARLEAEVAARRVRRVYVFRLDRLTRSGIADTLDVVKRWRALSVHIVNLRDGFSVPGPGADGSEARIAELILAILAWAAEMELLTRRERIAARRDLAEERGEAWGRPCDLTPAGWSRVHALKAEGRTVRSIAMALKITRSKVQRALSRNAPPLPPSPKALQRRAAQASGG
jgi:DNA invertase Pin-like site-specific DNA recombinase